MKKSTSKYLYSIFLVLTIVSMAGQSLAAESTKEGSLDLGVMLYYYDYNEYANNSLLDGENGLFYGFTFGATGVFDNLFTRINLEYTNTYENYHGATWSGVALNGTDPTAIFNVEGNIGLLFTPSFVGYTGIGYHHWYRGGLFIGDYSENYSWFYLPVGVIYNINLSALTISIDGSARLLFGSSVTANFSESIPVLDNITQSLGSKLGAKLKISFRYNVSDNLALSLTPWYEYSALGKSALTNMTAYSGSVILGQVYEPDSTTNQYGMTFAISFLLGR